MTEPLDVPADHVPSTPLPERLINAGIGLRRENVADRAFVLGLYADGRAAELAAAPWSPLDKLRFLGAQFAAQEAHYRANEADADRWIVTRGEQPIGRLYVARGAR